MSAREARKMFHPSDKQFSRAEDRALARDELVYNVTEDLLVLLEKLQVSKVGLARHLGKSRSYVSQLLSGSRNMTLGTLADICFTLGVSPKFSFSHDPSNHCALVHDVSWHDVPEQKPQLTVVKAIPIFKNLAPNKWRESDGVAA